MSAAVKPQFIAIKIASVAPTTESAPLMPQAQATICGARRLSRRMPAGIGSPSVIPTGSSSATATAILAARGKGIAQATTGEMNRFAPSATAAAAAIATSATRRKERHRQRVNRVAEQQHEPLQQRYLEQHEAGPECTEVRQPGKPA